MEEYAFARCDHRIEAQDFDPSFHDASIVGATMGHMTKQLTWVLPLMQALPDWVTVKLNKDMASYVNLQNVSCIIVEQGDWELTGLGYTQANRDHPGPSLPRPQASLALNHLPRDPEQQTTAIRENTR